eukprot:SAG11_NODE_16336_length_550_cov_1.046563_1_plen_138_part_10
MLGHLDTISSYSNAPHAAEVAAAAAAPDPLEWTGRVMSAADRAFWEREGYVCIPNAVPLANCEAVRRELFGTLGASESDPESWYEAMRAKRSYQMFTTQGIWNNRQAAKVHRAFAELWGTDELWVSSDGVGLRLPDRP